MEIAVVNGGESRVLDESDREVCLKEDPQDPKEPLYCSWQRKWTGPLHINIRNAGRVDVVYRIEAR